MSESALVATDIAAGRLVRPFDVVLPSAAGYYVVYPTRSADRRKVKVFRDWLFAEAEAATEGRTVGSR